MTDSPARPQSPGDGEFLPLATGMLLFIPLVLAGNVLGAVLRYPDLGSAVLFPPYAVLTAALVASHRRDWGWYIAVGAIAHAIPSLSQWPLSWVVTADLANIVRAVLASVLLRWRFRGVPRISDTTSLLEFILIAVITAPATAAVIGSANMLWHGQPVTFVEGWTAWFISNALTGLTMLPGLMTATRMLASPDRAPSSRSRIAEGVGLSAALLLACGWSLSPAHLDASSGVLFAYAPIPFLIWAGLRFGVGGASLGLTAVALAGIFSADRSTGPFHAGSPGGGLLSLQLFMLLTAVPVLFIAAVATARLEAVRLYRALMASMHDQVAILDGNGRVIEVNESWRRFAEEAHESPFDHAGVGADFRADCRREIMRQGRAGGPGADIAERTLAAVDRALAGGKERFIAEYEHGENGTARWFDLTVEALDRPERGAVITRSDASGRRRAQRELELRREEVSHLARVNTLGQIAGTLTHELTQPIATSLMGAQSALDALNDADLGEVRTTLGSIAQESGRASRVLQGLRAMLQRSEPNVRQVDPAGLVASVMQLVRAQLVSRHVTVRVEVEPELPPLLVDEIQAQQVLLNLILNACDSMESAGKADRVLLLTIARAERGLVRLSVRDSGTGIPDALLSSLFEPFVTTKEKGLGLGLSISRTIILTHGGRLWAENNPDRGATFHCELRASASPLA